MEFSWILVLLISSILLFITLFVNLLKRNPPKNLPPGPPKLPIIGNLHQLSSKNTLPHRRLAELARLYGHIMHLQLGEIPTVVISSPETAKEVLKTHDWVFCNRPKLLMAQVVYKNYSDIALSPYNEYWREVRKIATLELFTARRILEFRPFREEAIMDFIKSLLTKAKEGSVIDLTTQLFSLSFDITLRLSMNQKAKDGEEFRKLIAEISELITGFSINDLYPSLKFISSISGMNRKLKSMVKKLDMLMDPIIEQHIHDKSQRKKDGDLVDVLLKYYKDEDDQHHANQFSLTKDNIKTIIFELFGAGGETSSTTMDWAFSELIRNPIVMKKAQNEVRQVLQENKIMIDEADLEKLKYLKLIIKETLRLHPPLPCLIPRESMRKCEIDGYDIPSKTRVLINVWAIGRDIKCWKEPESFNPERFDGCLIDYKGTYFELIPFGAGRRMCPGIGLGVATIELVMAMLLYHFDWKLPDGIKDEDVDMDEVFGIMGRRKTNLQLIPLLHPISGFHINK